LGSGAASVRLPAASPGASPLDRRLCVLGGFPQRIELKLRPVVGYGVIDDQRQYEMPVPYQWRADVRPDRDRRGGGILFRPERRSCLDIPMRDELAAAEVDEVALVEVFNTKCCPKSCRSPGTTSSAVQCTAIGVLSSKIITIHRRQVGIPHGVGYP